MIVHTLTVPSQGVQQVSAHSIIRYFGRFNLP